MTRIFERQINDLDESGDMKMKCDSQSLSFYSDISNFIAEHIAGFRSMSLLDVGARTASGTALLRAIHHPRSYARIKLNPVTALDLDVDAIEKARDEYRDLDYLSVNISTLRGVRQWDIVLSSHTIEHVEDPGDFIKDLEGIAKCFLIVACPFAEENLVRGHIQRLNLKFFEERHFTQIRVYRSLHWHNGMACIALKPIE